MQSNNRYEWFKANVGNENDPFPISSFTFGTSTKQAAVKLNSKAVTGYVFGHVYRRVGEDIKTEIENGVEKYVLELHLDRASGGEFTTIRETIPVAGVRTPKQAVYLLVRRAMETTVGYLLNTFEEEGVMAINTKGENPF